MCGLFRHEMHLKFPVIVAEQGDFRKYGAKRTEYPRECREMIYFAMFHRIYTDIFVVSYQNDAFLCVFR